MKLSIQVIANQTGTFTAFCPALPGCVSQGATQEEATSRLAEVVRGYIAAVSNFVPDQIEYELCAAPSPEETAALPPGRTGAIKRPAKG
jgi:predicted RNase H-like HicB family nuclease